jgi:hypothetical protein
MSPQAGANLGLLLHKRSIKRLGALARGTWKRNQPLRNRGAAAPTDSSKQVPRTLEIGPTPELFRRRARRQRKANSTTRRALVDVLRVVSIELDGRRQMSANWHPYARLRIRGARGALENIDGYL